MALPRSPVRNLRTLLSSLDERTEGETVTVSDLLTAVGRRAYGPVLLLLGFLAISPLTIIPGSTWLVALVTLIFALQMLVGMKTPWLPKRVLEVSFPRKQLLKAIEVGTPYAQRVDRLVRPRLVFLTEPPFVQLVALSCIVAALITFPLGLIPFGPVLPGLTILVLGLGLTARDGFVILIAGVILAGSGLLLMHLLPNILGKA